MLQEFNGSSECKKCGASLSNKCEYVWTAVTEPHLQWECSRCGYRWMTKTKDAPKVDSELERGGV